MSIARLAYFSKASPSLSKSDVQSIVDASQKSNREQGITGILIYLDGVFAQALEGEQEAISSLYDRIKQDPRHTDVHTIYEGPADTLMFPQWTMAYVESDLADLLKTAGLADTDAALSLFDEGGSQGDATMTSPENNLHATLHRALAGYAARLSQDNPQSRTA